jgi:hypothetical protein
MEIKVAQRVYVLTEEYTDKDGNPAVAKVKLTVDEQSGTFDVLPGDGMDSFHYKSRTKADYNMWAAAAKLTYMAVEFGLKEITPKEVNDK